MGTPDTRTVTGSEYAIGAEVTCAGETCGEVTRVVVDPMARRLTHLVVDVKAAGEPRLVPIELVAEAGEQIRLACTKAELAALDPAVEVQFLPGEGALWGYPAGETLLWPYYGLGVSDPLDGGVGIGIAGPPVLTRDRIPRGEVELRRGDSVKALDGGVGRVQGLVIDARDDHVTHVLLEEGHLWGKKQVAIPITAVTGIGEDGARVSLTTRQIRDLPPVEIDSGGHAP